MPRYASFVVRSWHSSRHGRVQWVGRLEHLQDGRCEQFTSADALLARLRPLLAPPAPDTPTGPERGGEPRGPTRAQLPEHEHDTTGTIVEGEQL